MSKFLTTLQKIDLELLGQTVDMSYSLKQVAKYLNLDVHPRNFSQLKAFLLELDLDTSHFTHTGKPKVNTLYKTCPNCGKEFAVYNSGRHKDQKTCSTGCYNSLYRKGKDSPNYVHGLSTYRNLAIKHYGHVCQLCGYSEIVVVHHKDRDRSNNSLNNLMVLCPNCHAKEHWLPTTQN